MKTKRIAVLAMLTAVALIIFTVELQIPNPFPVPGIKLGLANVITVYAVYRFKPYEAAMTAGVRILLGSIFSGNMTALIYSAAGTVLCLAGMIPLRKIIGKDRIWVSSVIGAALHNTGQLATAVAVLQTPSIVVYYPFLLVSGCLAGAFTGICAQLVIKRTKRFL